MFLSKYLYYIKNMINYNYMTIYSPQIVIDVYLLHYFKSFYLYVLLLIF